MAELLISRGARVNARNEYECTPLHFAAGRGDAEVVAILLQRGIAPDVRDSNNETPLHWAAMRWHNIDTGFDDSIWARTPVQKLATAKVLLDHGANVNARNASGTTPVFLLDSNDVELAQFLIGAGADIRIHNEDRSTPLNEAVRRARYTGMLEVVRLFLQHNADVDALDMERKRPIDYAGHSSPKLVELLNAKGASTRPLQARE